ncbi:methyltransferase domain-containing [Fusarium albosuccineum]|uniref:Methyltransferase domain-containing n=1 Tax=Fusarium albosuccineum TaxID=1237068 RepID=A0A8H4PAT3_9HYPO|nr:methyltransferase domain-containing [Fusarium albosuccineum]
MSDNQVEKPRDAPQGTPRPLENPQTAEEKSPSPAAPAATSPVEAPQQSTAILPPEHWQHAEIDPSDNDDADSGLQEGESSTASITSSILKYRTILGRTFHSEQGDAHYWGANDERQNEAMDINHHCQTLCLDGNLHLAPLDDGIKKAVDIGTGTGIWAIDFADQFPGCEVIGTDISPIQPSWIPPNLQFQIDDCTREWTFEEGSLDYIHIRFLTGCIADWNALFKEAYRCLKPGGYLESMEPSGYIESDDNTIHEEDAMGQWGKIFVEGGKKIGRTFLVVQEEIQNKAMAEAGFVDIQQKLYKASIIPSDCRAHITWLTSVQSPIGGWPKDEKLREIGQYAQLVMEQDFEGLILFMTNVLGGWTREEIQVYVAHLRREIRSGKKHGWYWQKVVWARKPESG